METNKPRILKDSLESKDLFIVREDSQESKDLFIVRDSQESEIDVKLLLIEQQKSIDFEEKRYLGRNNKSQVQAEHLIDQPQANQLSEQASRANEANGQASGTMSSYVNIVSLFNENNIYKLRSELNPCSNFRREYLVLDTLNRIPNDRTGLLRWNYVSTNVYQATAVATKTPIRDLVGMRIYPIHLYGNLGLAARYGSTFSLLIEEFGEQAFIAHQNRKFHFLLRNTNSVPQDLTPMNDGFFWFNFPITTINTLTVSIANPLVENTLLSAVSQLNTAGNVTVTTTTIQVSLAFIPGFIIGNKFNFDGWSTTNPTADTQAIATINKFTGLTLLSGNSTLLFAIDPPIPALVGALNGNRFVMYDETSRIIIPLEMIFIDPQSHEIDD
jgi:hypothetical protein